MAQENVDVVVKSSGTKRVVVDINEIGNAAIDAQKRIDRMMKTLQNLAGGGLIGNLRSLQSALNGLASTNLAHLQAQIAQLNSQIPQLQRRVSGATSSFNLLGSTPLAAIAGLRSALHSVMLVLGVRQIAEWADAWTEAAGKINIFAKSQEESNFIIEKVFEIAQRVRQPLSAMADLYHRLTISGSELGASQNQMLAVTETVGKALGIQGTSVTKARGALLQLSQALAQGRVRAQEYNSIQDGLSVLLKIVAKNIDGAAGSTAKLRQMMLDGKLSSQQFFQAILKGSAEIDALYAKAPKTFAQGWTTLVNGIERYLGKLNESWGLSDKFHAVTSFISQNLDTIGRLLTVVGTAALAAFAPTIISAFAAGVTGLLPLLLRMAVLLNANPFAVLVTAAVAAYQFGDSLNIGIDKTTTLKDLMIAMGQTIADVWETIKWAAVGYWNDIVNFAQKAYNWITGATSDATSLWSDSYGKFYADTGKGLAGFFMALAKTADAIGGLILGLGIGVVRAMEGLPGAFVQIGKGMYNGILEWIERIVNTAIAGVNQLRGLMGGELIAPLQFERAQVDEHYFKNYGANIASSLDAGFEMQGNFLQTKLGKLYSDAEKIGAQRHAAKPKGAIDLDTPLGTPNTNTVDKNAARRAAQDMLASIREALDKYKADAAALIEAERHKEVMLKNSYEQGLLTYRDYTSQLNTLQQNSYNEQKSLLEQEKTLLAGKLASLQAAMKAKGSNQLEISTATQDITTKIQELDQALLKLNNRNQERLSEALTKAIGPAVELTRNAEKELALAELNTSQQMRKLDTKNNINQLSERELFIQERLNGLTDKYEDTIEKLKQTRDQMSRDGAFDDMANPAVKAAWDSLNSLIGRWEGSLARIKRDAPELLGRQFDAEQVNKFAKDLNEKLADAIINAGNKGARNLKSSIIGSIKEALKNPFRMVVQTIMQPISNAISSFVMGGMQQLGIPGMGSGSTGFNPLAFFGNMGGGSGVPANPFAIPTGGGSGMLGTIGNGIGSLFGFPGAGDALTGALATGANALGFGAGANAFGMGGVSAGMSGAAEAVAMEATLTAGGTGAGALAGIASAIPVIGWGVAAAGLLYSIFGKKGGGPKQDAVYGNIASSLGQGERSTQGDAALRSTVLDLQKQYDEIVKIGGGTSAVKYGMGFSMDPKGDAPTMLDVTGTSMSGQTALSFFRNDVGRSEEELKTAMTEMASRALLTGLQQSGLQGVMGQFLQSLNPAAMAISEVTDAIERVTKASKERATLEDRLFELTHTAAETLARTRAKDLETVDEMNRALLLQVQAAEDSVEASQALAQAQAQAASIIDDARNNVKLFSANIAAFLAKLDVTPSLGGGTPYDVMMAAKEQFQAQVAKVDAGDRTAMQGITGFAEQLIQAQQAYSASGPETAATVAYVRQVLSSLPAQVTAEEVISRAIADGSVKIDDRLQEVVNVLISNNSDQINTLNGLFGVLTQAQIDLIALQHPVSFPVQAPSPVLSTPVPTPTQVTPAEDPWYYVDTTSRYADGGVFGGGWRMVGERGWELESTGASRIYNQREIGHMLASGDSEVAEKLDRVISLLEQTVVIDAESGRRIAAVLGDVAQTTAEGVETAKRTATSQRQRVVIG